jgi:hypothetical protein
MCPCRCIQFRPVRFEEGPEKDQSGTKPVAGAPNARLSEQPAGAECLPRRWLEVGLLEGEAALQ